MISRIARHSGQTLVIHGRAMAVTNVRRTGQHGWAATFTSGVQHFLGVQTTPPTVSGDPDSERWLVMVGRTPRYFAVNDAGIRDLAS